MIADHGSPSGLERRELSIENQALARDRQVQRSDDGSEEDSAAVLRG